MHNDIALFGIEAEVGGKWVRAKDVDAFDLVEIDIDFGLIELGLGCVAAECEEDWLGHLNSPSAS